MVYSCSRSTCLPQIDYSAEESHFSQILWVVDLVQSSKFSSGSCRGGEGLGQDVRLLAADGSHPPQWVCLLGKFAPRCPCLTSPAIETCCSSWHCDEAVIVPLCVLVPSYRAYRVTAVRLSFGSQSLIFLITPSLYIY